MPRGTCENCGRHNVFVYAVPLAAGRNVFVCPQCLALPHEWGDDEDDECHFIMPCQVTPARPSMKYRQYRGRVGWTFLLECWLASARHVSRRRRSGPAASPHTSRTNATRRFKGHEVDTAVAWVAMFVGAAVVVLGFVRYLGWGRKA